MGRASNRKKAHRQAAYSARQARQSSGADAATQQVTRQLVDGLQALIQAAKEREQREASACRAWCGGAEPIPPEAPRWPEGSLGDRFLTGTYLAKARNAPCLLTGEIPDAAVIAAVLPPVLDSTVPGLDGRVVADALIGAFTEHYRCELPGDAEVLQRIGRLGGDALENLIAAGVVPAGDVLPVGLTVLSALAEFCRSSSASVLRRAA